MKLCTCGHRDARHDQLIGCCSACSCWGFEDDVESLIEEEIEPDVIYPSEDAIGEAAEEPAPQTEDITQIVDGGGEGIRTYRAPADEPVFPLPPLESYDAWRCPDCCSRWFSNRRCCGVALQPIRVEIHSREVGYG